MAMLTDRREWDALVSVFSEDVAADYTALTAGEAGRIKASDLVNAWKGNLEDYVATQHLVTNHEIELTGDSARATAYFQATHCRENKTLWILAGKYRFELVRHGGRWLISAVTMTPLWARDESNTIEG